MTESVEQPRFIPWLRRGLATNITEVAVAGMAELASASASVTVTAHGDGPAGDTSSAIPSPPVALAGPGNVVGFQPTEIISRYPAAGTDDAEPNYFAHIEFASADLPWRYTPAAADGDDRLQPWLALVVVPDGAGVTLTDQGSARLPVLAIADDAASQLPDLAQSWAWAHTQAEHDLADGVAEALESAPERFRSRLICPRHLEPNRSWIACLVPTFEVGRLAGLGSNAAATRMTAWTSAERGALDLPVYASWRFSTGPIGDFESLVRRLTPRTLPGSVGRRDLDLTAPGGGLTTWDKAIVSYEGALVSPLDGALPWDPAHRQTIADELTNLVNATVVKRSVPSDYNALQHDPVVGPPAHGAPQAHQRRIPKEGEPPYWFRELNTEPPNRAVAGLGAEVVRNDQEALMAVAWDHVSELSQANQILSRARLAWEVGTVAKAKLNGVGDDRLLQLAGPALHRCSVEDGQTLRGAVASSDLPDGLLSGPMRRLSHNVNGMTVRTQGADDGPVERRQLSDLIIETAVADPVGLVSKWSEIRTPPGTDPAATAAAAPSTSKGQTSEAPRASGHRRRKKTSLDGETVTRSLQSLAATTGGRPREQILETKRPMTSIGVAHRAAGQPVDTLAADLRATIDPPQVVRSMVDTRIVGLDLGAGDRPVPARINAEPLFTTPMYKRLAALSMDYLVPGIGDVADDTLGLLEVNRPFIEAFFVGLNHEMSREMLWREYPARLDRTWFRQFWDTAADSSYDITPIDRWEPKEQLGKNRPARTVEAGLVLLIKGALPRRYPDLRIYAVEAEWQDGVRRELTSKKAEVYQPLFTGSLGQGVHFYGFGLTENAARGSTKDNRHPGYFFVLEEQVGRPRFGLDEPKQNLGGAAPARWSGLSWSHLAERGGDIPEFVSTAGPQWLIDAGPLTGNGGRDSWGDNSAAMARITLQRPVRMLVHASAMLPDADSDMASLSRSVRRADLGRQR